MAIRSVYFIALLAAQLIFSATEACAQSKKNRTTESIVVKTKTKEFKKGEFVKLVFTVINDTDVHVEINKTQFYFPKCASIMITGPEGSVPCKVPDQTETPFPKHKMAPGSYSDFEYNISRFWDLSLTGEYQVVFYYTMSNGVSKAAPVATFRVVE